ncbi:Txe/YoeB family addiction module toxin [Hanamia caeni]|jgi:toxin YoeB|uniref:Putative mRNA interferase YoeB n=1 Tax=Hanamia caeni TaxID=2294116 RepID=A0A3M9N318_9BACT|nr:Txe/YoeB family addiction module toxin [Hanamia caeni]RNI32200.1 Txe/YoeB family addiction module toxin [Hanamia caeni]
MKYDIEFSLEAKQDIERLKKSGDKKLLKKLYAILTELKEHPKTGTGKPELLKYYKTQTWSRRLSEKHRVVYRIYDETVTVLILTSWGHYDDK